jgi:SAM-dependent methyltransferase
LYLGIEMLVDNSGRVRRIIQTITDLAGIGDVSFSDLRILDLGSAHGQYSLDLAKRGATTLGIEGRQSWVDHASSQIGDIQNVEFLTGDARDISVKKFGRFDVTLCLGLLYHLDSPDVFELLANLCEMTASYCVIDTQIATHQPIETRAWRGHTYSGWPYLEHPAGVTPQQKRENLGASLSDDYSFWLTFPSLLNALRHVGFSSVLEVRNPIDAMYQGEELRLHEDFITLVAIKGKPVTEIHNVETLRPQTDWPEDPSKFYLKRPWTPQPASHNPRPRKSLFNRFRGLIK